MKTVKLIKQLSALALALSAVSSSAGIYVSGSTIYENSSPFVMRGVNVAHAWYNDKTASSLSDIAKTGANTVRVVLATGKLWSKTSESQVASIISQAKANKLITVLEVHDTTGYGEQTAATLNEAVDYWIGIKNSLIGQEDYVVINIGNEPFGNGQSASAWTDGHKNAISRLRAAGFKHALMVDAANWGQDWQNIMRDNAASVLASDPQKNVIFSVHMYEVYGNASAINNYMTSFKNNGLALVVGEFAADHFGQNVDEGSIMSYAKQYNYGYLGWSWSGNGSGLTSLDIAQNFNTNTLSSWGNTLINGTNGIKATSKIATIFGGSSNSSCSATTVTPYLRINSGSWQQTATTTVSSGANVEFGPHPTSGGSWSWSGCGTSGTSRAQNVTIGSACNATATYTNSCGTKTTRQFTISLNGTSSSSSTAAGSSCNWYGTSYPICTSISSGWGWENNKSCIAQSTCNSQ